MSEDAEENSSKQYAKKLPDPGWPQPDQEDFYTKKHEKGVTVQNRPKHLMLRL